MIDRIDKSVSTFLAQQKNENTKYVYRAAIINFAKFLISKETYLNKEELDFFNDIGEDMVKLDGVMERYLENEGEEDYLTDFVDFTASLKNRPLSTVRSYISAIKEFFNFNGIEFSKEELKLIQNEFPKGMAHTNEEKLDIRTIDKILKNMQIKGKALFLVLLSSGMRLNEALTVDIEDLNLETTPSTITVKEAGGKTKRQVFITDESRRTLLVWLEFRANYLKTAWNKNKTLVEKGLSKSKENDNRLFPYSDNVALQIWNNALKNAELISSNSETKKPNWKINQLRKFYQSQLNSVCPEDVVDELMGLKKDGKHSPDQLVESYKKAEFLLKTGNNVVTRRFETELEEGQNAELEDNLIRENNTLKNEIHGINERMKEMDEKISTLQKDNNNLKSIVESIMKALGMQQINKFDSD